MSIELLVCDLDETLLVDAAPPSDRTSRAISATRSQGIKFAIATGRMHISALPYAKILDIDTPIISYNGALIKSHITDVVHHSNPVAYSDAIDVLHFAKEHGLNIQYYTEENYYFTNHSMESDYYHRATGVRGIATGECLTKTLDTDPLKLLISSDRKTSDRVQNLAESAFGDRLNIVRSSDAFVEFNNLGVSKGVACKKLASMYNIAMEKVMTIGNGGNDYDMVRDAGIGVAVDNSDDILKQVADFVAPSHTDDGAAIAIEKYILNI